MVEAHSKQKETEEPWSLEEVQSFIDELDELPKAEARDLVREYWETDFTDELAEFVWSEIFYPIIKQSALEHLNSLRKRGTEIERKRS